MVDTEIKRLKRARKAWYSKNKVGTAENWSPLYRELERLSELFWKYESAIYTKEICRGIEKYTWKNKLVDENEAVVIHYNYDLDSITGNIDFLDITIKNSEKPFFVNVFTTLQGEIQGIQIDEDTYQITYKDRLVNLDKALKEYEYRLDQCLN